MPRVVPSQVVALIDRHIPEARVERTPAQGRMQMGREYAPVFEAVVQLAGEIPAELITLSGTEYDELVIGIAGLKHMANAWAQGGPSAGSPHVPGTGRRHAVQLVRAALSRCRDEAPAAGTADLAFIADGELRDSIRLDISTAESAFRNGEWKASTVLAGSATEALLLWAISQRPRAEWEATAAYPGRHIERWDLAEYIAVAAELRIITAETETLAGLTRGHRNLIHPGRAARLQQVCNRATALTALAAVERVGDDLAP